MTITFGERERRNAETLIELALAEDLNTTASNVAYDPDATSGDITSRATIPPHARGAARFCARTPGILAGLPVVAMLARRCGLGDRFESQAADGDALQPGQSVARVTGSMREILTFERTALNFLQRLSGVATLTGQFVAKVQGTRAVILDTRKTTPGWRFLEKYAVRCGGGKNHRIGLHDAVLIKDNHLASLAAQGEPDPIAAAIRRAREACRPGVVVEVEVDSLEQLEDALAVHPDIILIDNFPIETVPDAVRRRDALAPRVLLEVSGGVTLDTVADYARAGVDRISVGALTHSAPALDLGLDFAS